MSANMPAPLVEAFFAFSRGATYLDNEVGETTARLLGRPPRTFRAWVHAHAHAGDFTA